MNLVEKGWSATLKYMKLAHPSRGDRLKSSCCLFGRCKDRQHKLEAKTAVSGRKRRLSDRHHWHFLGLIPCLFFEPSFFSQTGCFPCVFDGFLKRRIPGKNGESTSRAFANLRAMPSSRRSGHKQIILDVDQLSQPNRSWLHFQFTFGTVRS